MAGPFDSLNIDWAAIEANLGVALSDQVREFGAAEESDLGEFGASIASHVVAAIRSGNADMRAELRDQVIALGKISKMRLTNAEWSLFGAFVGTIGHVVFGALKSFVPV